MDLTVTVDTHGASTVAHLCGDIDAYTAPLLRAALLDLVQQNVIDLVVDMGDVTFLDSTGLGVLVATLHRQGKAGGSLRLAAVGDRVLKILQITALDTVFEIL